MPLTRYRVRSEYGLADPELYRAADKDDPEALLEGVAMAGLVGVLRQLGDLAEFAAEIFHDLHEEVLATAARGHGLIVRVQQLEAEFPPIEKALLSHTNQSLFHYNTGVEWHPNLRCEQNLIARGDLPRFVMDSYEESRGPPRLFLLDKFDVAGAGACLKRYTDPSFFKVEAAASGIENVEIPREKKNRRVKKKGLRWRNGETTPEVVPASRTKLEQLLLEERIENGHSDPARLVKLRKRHLNGSVVDPGTGKSYMEKFVETPKERELAYETSIVPVSFTPEYASESGIRILEISTVSSAEKSQRSESAHSSPSVPENVSKSSTGGYDDEVHDAEVIKVPDTAVNDETFERSSRLHDVQVERQLAIYREGKPRGTVNGYESDDVTSEVDNYMDAVASMESEMETDNEYRPKSAMHSSKAENHGTDSEANEEQIECRTQLSDSQSVGNFSTSDDGNNSFKRNQSSFSYSDSPSSLVENTPLDPDQGAKVSHSAEICASEIVNDPSNEISVTTESLRAMPNKQLVSPDPSVEEEVPAHGETFSSGLDVDLLPTRLLGDLAASSSTPSLVAPKTGGTPTEQILPDSRVQDTVDIGADLVDSIAFKPQVSSNGDNITKTSGRYLANELEAEGSNAFSDGILHGPNISELAYEHKIRVDSINEDFQLQEELKVDENEPQSTTEKQLCSSSLPDSETSSSNSLLLADFPSSHDHSDVLEPDQLVPGVNDSVSTIRVHTEDPSLALDAGKSHMPEDVHQVDPLKISGLKEPHLSDFSEDIPHVKPVLAEASVLFPKERPNGNDFGEGDLEDTGSSTGHADEDGGNAVFLEHPPSHPSDPGNAGKENLDCVTPEVVEVDVAAIHSGDTTGMVDRLSNGIHFPAKAICSPPKTTKLQEPLEGVSPECDVESETFHEVSDLELGSADLGLIAGVLTSYRHSSPEVCDDNEDSLLAENAQNSFSINDSSETSISLDARHQEPESNINDKAEAMPSTADQVSVECPVMDEAAAHPEFLSERSQVQADQLGADHVEVVQSSIDSSGNAFKYVDMGENFAFQKEASFESLQELPGQSSMPELSSKLDGQEAESINQASFSFESVTPPNIVLLPEATQVDLVEMPPLPPLPPMQWRMGFGMGMGNFQHTSLEGNRGLFPAIQPSRANEKAEVLPAVQDGTRHLQEQVFPLAIGEDEKFQHVAESEVVNLAPPSYSVQLPAMFPDADSQYNPVSAISSERHEHGHLAALEEVVQSASSSFSPQQTTQYSNPEKPDVLLIANQPPNKPALKAGLDATAHQLPLQTPDIEEVSSFVTPVPPSAMADEQVRLSLVMPIGDTRWSSNTSSTVLESETEKENGDQVPKVPRPRNPLIDEVNAHGTSKLRKVAERVRPQLGPKADDRDSWLQEIRTKSFKLKPTTAMRPNIGPTFNKTNLKVAAILEKANAIRQAMTGSDDEDDEDNWE